MGMDKMKPISVLFVDENHTFLRIAIRLLEMYDDITVIGAVHGIDRTLTQIETVQPDVILIDISSFSNPPGLQVISQLRTALPGVRIIALTLIGIDSYRQAALEAGADAFVPKVTMGTELLPAIRRVMQSNQTREGNRVRTMDTRVS
jgi:two-component system response regulator DesR